ncbi:protein serine/threonine phosphatase [Aureococcus anophagefferens]|nr:protein serine/threonine phosphatase [Aureococcus anophagefferens]
MRGVYPWDPTKPCQDSFFVNESMVVDGLASHWFAVMDGHGPRRRCAHFIRDNLEKVARKLHKKHPDWSWADVLSNSYETVNAMLHRCVAKPLSSDQTPYRKDERERLRECGARVLTIDQLQGRAPLTDDYICALGDEIDEGGDPPRVFLMDDDVPGTAFSRSIGDYTAETVGCIATPEISETAVGEDDVVVVIASDGVWEFLTNQVVLDMCLETDDPFVACNRIVAKAAYEWVTREQRTDDISCIVVYLNDRDGKPLEATPRRRAAAQRARGAGAGQRRDLRDAGPAGPRLRRGAGGERRRARERPPGAAAAVAADQGHAPRVRRVSGESAGQLCVAKKVPTDTLNQRDREAAHRECALLRTLEHPHIVNFVESWESERDDGQSRTMHLIMEWCEQGDLAYHINEKKAAGERRRWRTSGGGFTRWRPLEYMHRRRVLHRDLKSTNVFVDGKFHVKLGDLGIAKILDVLNDDDDVDDYDDDFESEGDATPSFAHKKTLADERDDRQAAARGSSTDAVDAAFSAAPAARASGPAAGVPPLVLAVPGDGDGDDAGDDPPPPPGPPPPTPPPAPAGAALRRGGADRGARCRLGDAPYEQVYALCRSAHERCASVKKADFFDIVARDQYGACLEVEQVVFADLTRGS